jgi:glycosyltransferase involved in cell wall biosynthesis
MVPGRLDQRTGGYLYDARMVEGLRALGRSIEVHELKGRFPDPDAEALTSLGAALARVETGGVAVVDGLAGGGLPDVLAAHAGRVRIVALVHHPLADETGLASDEVERFRASERRALAVCRGVVVTSGFTAARLGTFGVPADRIRVVLPGTDPAEPAVGPGPDAPPGLLCVASLTPRKGHDVLLEALGASSDLPWTCTLAGSAEHAPAHAAAVRGAIHAMGLSERIELVGECDARTLDAYYRRSTLFVLASYYEGYGMALAEALARGLPVVSTTGGAIPYTVPDTAGILVPPGNATALAGALRALLTPAPPGAGTTTTEEGRTLARLRAGAQAHAATLPGWDRSVRAFARAVDALAMGRLPA